MMMMMMTMMTTITLYYTIVKVRLKADDRTENLVHRTTQK